MNLINIQKNSDNRVSTRRYETQDTEKLLFRFIIYHFIKNFIFQKFFKLIPARQKTFILGPKIF